MSDYRLISESFPNAKKRHKCVWCGEWIHAGEKYRREKSVYDGDLQDFAWHPECDSAFKKDFAVGVNEFVLHDQPRGKPYFAEPAAIEQKESP